MKLTPVESSNLKAVGYDPETKAMRVQFHSGDTWSYADVSEQEHSDLMASKRKGVHFHHLIRKHKTGTKVE